MIGFHGQTIFHDSKKKTSIQLGNGKLLSSLTKKIVGINEEFRRKRLDVIEEKPLTLYLNDQEIVTMMTVSDYPKYLAVGYLLNQNMITKRTKIEKIDYDDDLNVVVVRTKKKQVIKKN